MLEPAGTPHLFQLFNFVCSVLLLLPCYAAAAMFNVNNNEAVFCFQAKKPLHNGSYEHRVPKIKKSKHFSVPGMFICVIQHRNWPLRSTTLNPHGTNASPDGLCTRTHTSEAFSCWFCCNSFRVDRARRGNVCL